MPELRWSVISNVHFDLITVVKVKGILYLSFHTITTYLHGDVIESQFEV